MDTDYSLDDSGPADLTTKSVRSKSSWQVEKTAIVERSSLPISVKVGRGRNRFKSIPILASNPPESKIDINSGPCKFSIKTSTVQVEQFIFTGEWVKLREALPSGYIIKTPRKKKLFFRLTTGLKVDIDPKVRPTCYKFLTGKKFYVGSIGINRSKIAMTPSSGSPRVKAFMMKPMPESKKVFLNWPKTNTMPILEDDMELPFVLNSPIYGCQPQKNGFYYLSFSPLLSKYQ